MLKAYMGFNKDAGSNEGACLIFANTSNEAKKIGFDTVRSWFNTGWSRMGVRRVIGDQYFKEADQEKLTNGTPHVIDNPECCPRCDKWGAEWIDLDKGYCSNCYGRDD